MKHGLLKRLPNFRHRLRELIETDESFAELTREYDKAAEEEELNGRSDDQAQAETLKGWQTELKNDQDVGGANLKSSVQAVRGLIERAGGEQASELLNMLNDSGMTDFPPLFKFLHRIASAVGEDAFAGQGRGTPKSDEDAKLRKRYHTMFND